jgi:polysaccharide export outer membrane protein
LLAALWVTACAGAGFGQNVTPGSDGFQTIPSGLTQTQTQTPAAPGAAAPPAGASATVGPIASSELSSYAVSPGDLLEVVVYGVPDLTERIRVSVSGDAYLPLVGYVHLAGLTVDDAQDAVEAAYREGRFMNSPHVNIAVAEYANGVAMMGEVVRPGIYPVMSARRLFDLITAAGGTTSMAGKIVSITHADSPKAHQIVTLSNDPRKAMDANVLVYQGDTVIVSKAGVVYIVGDVLQPSAFIMEDKTDYTVLKVLAMAHGAQKTASLDHVRIVRKSPSGLQEIPVPLKKIMRSKAPDMPMQAEDILFVPSSATKETAYQSLSAIVSLATGIALIGASRGL